MTIYQFDIENGVYQFNERNLITASHSHPALEIIIAKEGAFSLITKEITLENVRCALVRPNQMHTFVGLESNCDFIFFEPGNAVLHFILNKIGQLACCDGILTIDKAHFETLIAEILQQFKGKNSFIRIPDSRILKCINLIKENLDDTNLTLSKMATEMHLSPSRLSHLFKAQIGLSIRKYIIWTRMKFVVDQILNRHLNLTQAAHSGGFHDSSHFTKNFKKIFGVKPSLVYNNSRIVQVLKGRLD